MKNPSYFNHYKTFGIGNMRKALLVLIIFLTSCGRLVSVKNNSFNCSENNYKMNSDLKEVIYKSLKRAVVTEKDIPDYSLIRDKYLIYVLNKYQTDSTNFVSPEAWEKSLTFLRANEIPNKIENISFCLKSKEELQKISNRTRTDFLSLSFSLIKIDNDTAIIKISNNWIVSKYSNKVYLSGGGYGCIYKKINGTWKFMKKTSSWIS